MLKKKKVIIFSGVILVLVFGTWYAVDLVRNKMYSQIMTYVDTPEVKKQIEDATKQLNDNPEIANKITAEVNKTQVDNIEKSAAAAIQAPSIASAAGLDKSSATVQETGKTPVAGSATSSSVTDNGKADAVNNGTNNSPTVQQPPANKPANKPVLESRAQAESFALQHFSTSEIAHYCALYKDRSNLTAEQKSQIKKEILSRFSPQEIQAMLQASNK